MDCGRCNGKGTLDIKLGVPDPKRDTHAPYRGPWATFNRLCPVCRGSGQRRDKPNYQAGWRIYLDRDGRIIKREPLEVQ